MDTNGKAQNGRNKRSRSGSESPNRPRSRSRSPNSKKRVTTRNIVIANIPYGITWQKLKEIFRNELGMSGFLKMYKTNGKPNGMGLMEFKSLDGAQKAVNQMNKFEIENRKLIVREQTKRDIERMRGMECDDDSGGSNSAFGPAPVALNNPAVSAISSVTPQMLERMGVEGPLTNAVYVSNLDYNVPWQKLKDVFRAAGRVMNATIKTDNDNKSRGFGIVKFEHPYEAVQAIVMFNGQNLNGRTMRVKIDREATVAPPNLPLFPQTPNGMAACAAFLGMLNDKNSVGAGGNMNSHQSVAAAAAIADLLGGGSGNMGGASGAFGGPGFGLGGFGGGPLGNLAQALGVNLNSSTGRFGGGGGGMGGNNDIISAMANALGGGGGAMNGSSGPRDGFSGAGGMGRGADVPRDFGAPSGSPAPATNPALQQLLSAAAAGGMSSDQLEKVASQLGLPAPAVGGGMGRMNERPTGYGGRDNYDDYRRPQSMNDDYRGGVDVSGGPFYSMMRAGGENDRRGGGVGDRRRRND